ASGPAELRRGPDSGSLRVMTARPPAFSTAAATASESVATTASPIPAASAQRRTCTIIGAPCRSANGLPGKRVDARRAGMRMIVSGIGVPGAWAHVRTSKMPQALIRVARGQANRYLIAAARSLAVSAPQRHDPLREPNFDEFLRTEQDPRRRSRHLPYPARAQHRSRCPVRAGEADQAWVRYCRQGERRGRKRRGHETAQTHETPPTKTA